MTILTVTVNPSLDLATDVGKVESGYKLRCGPAHFSPGGGGVNVSRALARLGGRSRAFVAIGGVTGQLFRSQMENEAIDAQWFGIAGLTRQSVNISERASGAQFRFVLPGPDWSADETARAIEAIGGMIAGETERVRYVVASGSLPPGMPSDFYQTVGEIAERAGARLILDTSGRTLDAAGQGGRFRPYGWIMDQAEAEHLAGRPLPDLDALERFARELKSRCLAQIVILTFAEGGAVAISDAETVRLRPPKVDVVSKIGAGDSFVAGLTLELAAGASLREACAKAVAAAASAVTRPAGELCERAQTDLFLTMILNHDG